MALFYQGLKRREVVETTNPIKGSMMYTGMIGVKIPNEMTSVNKKVDCPVLEHTAQEVGQGANIRRT